MRCHAYLAPGLHGLGSRRPRIGLLGGSFNPAHDGHLHISKIALRRLKLDAVWWLVSPQNPLKSDRDMAPLAARMASANVMARHPGIYVSDLENRLGTRFSADTIAALQAHFPAVRFVWLMGADNLLQLPQWRRWQEIARRVPIAVFGRPAYSSRAMTGKVAQWYADRRLPSGRTGSLADRVPPAWQFIPIRLHPLSATALRRAGKGADQRKGSEQ